MLDSGGSDAWALAPFDKATIERLQGLLGRIDRGQRLWLSGYLAGTAAHAVQPAAPAAAAASCADTVVVYGSQSGNSEKVAKLLAERLSGHRIPCTILDMMDCRKSHLQAARTLAIVVSTHGDGDPPDRALPFFELLQSRKAPRLEHVSYSVLALGDSSYEKFCEAGRQFDARLEALGARRLHAREECDVDFEMPARRWIDSLSERIAALSGVHSPTAKPEHAAVARLDTGRSDPRTANVATAYTRKAPFQSAVLTNQRLTARGSTKDVRHIELSLEGSHIRYEPGDAIGVVPRNRADQVDALLAELHFDPEAAVSIGERTGALRAQLLEHLEIGPVNEALLKRYAQASGSQVLTRLSESPDDLQRYLHGRHLIDLVREHAPAGLGPTELVRLLRPLAPRLYSIASSQAVTVDEAHLTVSVVEYESFNSRRLGVVSGSLADIVADEGTAPIYLHRNPAFRLPADPRTAIIMIGPGTGVAPFRSFMLEREAAGSAGANWLFFGDRSFEHDFLYQSEWLAWRKSGLLTRIDVAFSRDQDEKVYVQHRIREHGGRLWKWLQEGAHLFVCGDAAHMAPDVHAALLEVIGRHGGLAQEAAAQYLTDLQRKRRYLRDVY